MKLRQDKFAELIEWRRNTKFPKGASPRQVCDSLSCEWLTSKDTPKRFERDIVAFRHLRQDARLQTVVAAFNLTFKPRKHLREPEVQVFAVCGYLSQKCGSMKEAQEWLNDRLLRNTYPRGFIVDGRVTVVEKRFQGLSKAIMK